MILILRMRLVVLAALALLASCWKGNEQAKPSSVAALPPGHPSLAAPAADLPDGAQQMLDSGNNAFRAKRFADAKAFYERAAGLAPEHAAPWFGIFLVGGAIKDQRLADSAMAEIRKRTGDGSMPVHPDTALRNPHASLPKS